MIIKNGLKIGFDLDEVVYPTVKEMLKSYNKLYDDNIVYDDLTEYSLDGVFKISVTEFFSQFATENFFKTIKPFPYVVEYINQLHKQGNEIYFITAGHSITILYRKEMLSQWFPWFSDKNLIKCTHKQLINVDILFDDCLDNLKNAPYIGVVVDAPWNRKDKNYVRMDSWEEWYNKLIAEKENR